MNYIKFISKDRGKYCGYNCIFYVANCAGNTLKPPHPSPPTPPKKNWITYKWNKIILLLDSTAVAFSRIKSHHHTITILEKYEYVAAILHVGINDLLRLDKNSTILGSICDDIFNGVLRFYRYVKEN